nr:hypothetical protein CFP56_02796 [Quercus suber]
MRREALAAEIFLYRFALGEGEKGVLVEFSGRDVCDFRGFRILEFRRRNLESLFPFLQRPPPLFHHLFSHLADRCCSLLPLCSWRRKEEKLKDGFVITRCRAPPHDGSKNCARRGGNMAKQWAHLETIICRIVRVDVLWTAFSSSSSSSSSSRKSIIRSLQRIVPRGPSLLATCCIASIAATHALPDCAAMQRNTYIVHHKLSRVRLTIRNALLGQSRSAKIMHHTPFWSFSTRWHWNMAYFSHIQGPCSTIRYPPSSRQSAAPRTVPPKRKNEE